MNISRIKKILLLLSLIGFSGAGYAALSVTPLTPTDTFKAESGQSIPTGTVGVLDGTLSTTTGALLTFTYGANLGLVAGATGHGDSTFLNEFVLTVDPTHDCFANHTGSACLNTGNLPFTVSVSAGNIGFQFLYDQTGGNHTLANGGHDNPNGAYLVTLLSGGSAAYLGLSDNTYPADNDFQDIALGVAVVPEPESYAMMLAGLGLMGFVVRRRNQKAA